MTLAERSKYRPEFPIGDHIHFVETLVTLVTTEYLLRDRTTAAGNKWLHKSWIATAGHQGSPSLGTRTKDMNDISYTSEWWMKLTDAAFMFGGS